MVTRLVRAIDEQANGLAPPGEKGLDLHELVTESIELPLDELVELLIELHTAVSHAL